jgi:hypothetical protein
VVSDGPLLSSRRFYCTVPTSCGSTCDELGIVHSFDPELEREKG